jgi:hypothetical protein
MDREKSGRWHFYVQWDRHIRRTPALVIEWLKEGEAHQHAINVTLLSCKMGRTFTSLSLSLQFCNFSTFSKEIQELATQKTAEILVDGKCHSKEFHSIRRKD